MDLEQREAEMPTSLAPDPRTGLLLNRPARALPAPWSDLMSAVRAAAALAPDAEALVDRWRRFTYREFLVEIEAAAAALWALGVRPGDRVAASGVNGGDLVIAFFASQRIGALWVGINRPLAPPEKAFQLLDSGASVFLADRAFVEQIEPLRDGLPELRSIVDMQPDDPDNAWRALVAKQSAAAAPALELDPYAPAAIAYTSGTTGRPKGAVHNQHNMMVIAATFHAGLRGTYWRPTLRKGTALPLTILNCLILDAVTPLTGGGTVVCVDRADALGIAEWVKAERIQTFTAAPTTMFDLLTRPEINADDLASLEFAGSGGSTVSDELRRLYHERFGRHLIGGYGLTEAPTSVAGQTIPPVRGSCGRMFEHIEAAILDSEDHELPAGEIGEIAVRGARGGDWAGVFTPMLGYWRKPEETAKALRNGWLHTGDVGSMDAEGNLFITDRLKDLIIRGGANIYPAEIERVLDDDPRVRSVAVIGQPDERLGEVVHAVVELLPGVKGDEALIDEFKAACLRELARYKVPERWSFVDEMPRNAMNKSPSRN